VTYQPLALTGILNPEPLAQPRSSLTNSELTMTLSTASKKERKHARESGGIAAAVTKQTAGKFA
jgi:hypothetical protein